MAQSHSPMNHFKTIKISAVITTEIKINKNASGASDRDQMTTVHSVIYNARDVASS